MVSHLTCLVTVHGVGFEQPPQVENGKEIPNSGYADPLHQHLSECLKEKLSDDPKRETLRTQPGENGVIYVESRYGNDKKIVTCEEGLKRLGAWCDDQQHIDITDAPLVPQGAKDGSVSHVALVYSNLEPMKSEVGATFITIESTLVSTSHYASVTGLIHMALTDGMAMIGHHTAEDHEPISSRPRSDLPTRPVKHLRHLRQAASTAPPGLLQSIRFIEDDLACYVCHNEERERVRRFVYESLMRLGHREDVDSIILNTHSNGSVIAFDVLRNLPEEVTRKIKAFVTAGSPLRKYVDLFHWGSKIQTLYPFERWYNFWEQLDPVADPLNPSSSWRVGDKIVSSNETLFSRVVLDSDEHFCIKVEDIQVDNVADSLGGGLQAHNYWDNKKGFVERLCEIVLESQKL